jgi:hypothetical protein
MPHQLPGERNMLVQELLDPFNNHVAIDSDFPLCLQPTPIHYPLDDLGPPSEIAI